MPEGIFETRTAEAKAGLVLTHGASSDCRSPLLTSIAAKLVASGLAVFRIDLAYRQKRPTGPPNPKTAPLDRESLREAAAWMRTQGYERIIIGGLSYGGRQASMLAAEQPEVAEGLLLLSYPLHPPGSPERLRTEHFPSLRMRSLFIQGTRDPFGLPDEIKAALTLIPGPVRLELIEGAGHDLRRAETPARVEAALTQHLL